MDEDITPDELFGAGVEVAPESAQAPAAEEHDEDFPLIGADESAPAAQAAAPAAPEAPVPVEPLLSQDAMVRAARLGVKVDELLAWKPSEVDARLATAEQYAEMQRQLAAEDARMRAQQEAAQKEQQQQFDYAKAVQYYKEKEFDPEMAIHLAQKDQLYFHVQRLEQKVAENERRQQQQTSAQAVIAWQSQIREGIKACPEEIQKVAEDPAKMQAILAETQRLGVQMLHMGQPVPNEVELAKKAAFSLFGQDIMEMAKRSSYSGAFRSGVTSRTRPSQPPPTDGGVDQAIREVAQLPWLRQLNGFGQN